MEEKQALWIPKNPSATQTARFLAHINGLYGVSPRLETYADLWEWSVAHRSDFWSRLWDWEGIIGDKGGPGPYVDESKTPEDNPTWFVDARLNWAENMLRHAKSRPDAVAVIETVEPCSEYEPEPKYIRQAQLSTLVYRAQQALVSAGVERGDRVAYWGGTSLASVVLLLATSSIGAIFSSAAADFGVDGVSERLEQIQPRVLVVGNGVVYNGAVRPLLPKLPLLLSKLGKPPSTVVVHNHLPARLVPVPEELKGGIWDWEEWLGPRNGEPTFVRMGFNEPIWILFSSGTTGKPKAIVHRQGAMLLDCLREHHLSGDISFDDVFFYYTTPGWMMYQYLVSGLATGCAIVLYEGSPLYKKERLWEFVDTFGITIFGTSAKWLEVAEKVYPMPKKYHKLSTLKQILSTGSPLGKGSFDWVYNNVKEDVLLGSITGGTDICSVFAGRCTFLPVYRQEIQARMLGFALTTEPPPPSAGELICRQAFPIQPLGFWPLPNHGFPQDQVAKAQERFEESYFKGGGNWYHGDYVQITSSRSGNSGGILMLGRSDGVLNPGGIRFGPTDIYSVLESDEYGFENEGIEEGLAVGLVVEDGIDEKVVLFIKMKDGQTLSEELVKKVKTGIRVARSARHVPAQIIQVSDIPLTLTNKRVEVPIRKVLNGAPVSSINPSTLRNPECLKEYETIGKKLREEEGAGKGVFGV
ncbi:acetoacetate-CoA ligase [Cryptococcus depauperatus CBS 7841]|uniref:Acetoacetate-CoA ligase n=1 Tax=Cryptococcus depauperatus CBS 7841 TaxID=1295531 RepID=A0AAJ8M3D7_9TREE